ncbi:MAG: hypothetical protein GEU99_25225 [Luteitalea sp.]|nr:hypothetical protein [Luteitalea sp.]
MATTDPHDTHVAPEGGHERSDVDVSRTPWLVIASAVSLAVVMAGMWLMFRVMEGQLASSDRPLPMVTERQAGQDRQPPEPRLLADEPADLARVQRDEEAVLNSYDWVDRSQGTVQVPIDRAMTLLIERGVPTTPEAPSPPPSNPGAGSPARAIATLDGAAAKR